MSEQQFDVTVIGAGPGGYVAAIRCAQLGLKTALIEKYSTLGGTCLNVGCIPSKALLDSSERFHQAAHSFESHGIHLENLTIDFAKMIARKDQVIAQTTQGIVGLMKKNKVEVIYGAATLTADRKVKVALTAGGETVIESKKIILATGSKPSSLPNINIDKKRIITSTEALKLPELPKSLLIIGGGVIGLEMGSVYARLGTQVTVVEYADSIIPTMDKELGKTLQRSLKKLGMEFFLGTGVQSAEVQGEQVLVKAIQNKSQKAVEWTADYVLVCTGRRPFTDGLGLENLGIQVDKRGVVQTNHHLETSAEGVFAIGDIVAGPMLAHKAEEEGVAVAEYISGLPFHVNYPTIPGVVYTWPEVAAVGQTEEQLKASNIEYKVGKFPFMASGRARVSDDTDGFVKVLADAKTDEILGVHMVGPRCADLISECVVAMEYRASAEDIARICHAHPTFSEAVKEAALDATSKRAIHI
jgi:dihydrolipoamide dehydrogenase